MESKFTFRAPPTQRDGATKNERTGDETIQLRVFPRFRVRGTWTKLEKLLISKEVDVVRTGRAKGEREWEEV